MPTEAEMMADLDAADKAGDTQLAQHIAGQIRTARSAQPTKTESFLRGGAQGATLGFGDEIQGAVQAAGLKTLPAALGGGRNTLVPWQKEFWNKDTPGSFFSREGAPPSPTDAKSLTDLYAEQRDVARKEDEAAKGANPLTYLAGSAAGAVLPAAAHDGKRCLGADGNLRAKVARGVQGRSCLWRNQCHRRLPGRPDEWRGWPACSRSQRRRSARWRGRRRLAGSRFSRKAAPHRNREAEQAEPISSQQGSAGFDARASCSSELVQFGRAGS